MSLPEKIDNDLKTAMKAGDKLRLETLRMVKSAVQYRQIEKGGPLSDEEVIAVLSTLSKQRRESIEQFRKGGREELALKEEAELQVLRGYMPAELSPEDLDRLIEQSIKDSGALGPADMGKVMRLLMPRVKGAADGKTVNEKVKAALSRL
ncbi:MAG: GatB/YqeY domain-containing protein [Nitrospiraceae bacterium]|nr:GatB/YqeY domain-containing protein [Nitrospiraceae bacterium]